jgi:quercetin dioxygenase-like cupin family protein
MNRFTSASARWTILGCLLAALTAAAWAQRESTAASGKAPLLESKTVTQAELQLPQKPFEFDGRVRGLMAQYFNGATAGTRSCVVGQFEVRAGDEPHPIHAHPDEELMIVTAGEGEITCDGKVTRVTAGAVMYAAPNVSHGIRNTGKTPLTFYFIKWIAAQP